MAEKLGIYFMGAGQIAVPVLRRLAEAPEIELTGVATQPDRPAGRGGRPTPTPVGAAAGELGLRVDKIPNVNDEKFLSYLRRLAPDMLLVISFGQLLRTPLLELPPRGCVNVHASLLPKYRGASPIVSVILNREDETGVSFMQMEKGLDTGGVYFTAPMRLVHNERADRLESMLGDIAAAAAVPVLLRIADGTLPPCPQDHAAATVCRKIRKADGRIDWRKSSDEVEAMCRAYYPWPGAFFTLRLPDRELPVTAWMARSRPELWGRPGEVLQCDKHGWIIGCGEGALELLAVSAPGKREMGATAFLNGLRGAAMEIPID